MFARMIGKGILVLALVCFSLPLYADTGSYQISVANGGKLWIDGNSTLHKYKVETTTFDLNTGAVSLNSPTVSNINAFLNQISGNFVLSIPVKSLKDPEPGFNGALRKDLKYKQHPNIVFSLSSATAAPDPSQAGVYDVTAHGILTVAGVQNPETLSAVFKVKGNTIRITGKKKLKMSDFGIKPPTMFFGTVKTDDAITIPWDISLSLS